MLIWQGYRISAFKIEVKRQRVCTGEELEEGLTFEVSISFRRTGGYPLRHMHEVHPVCRSSVHHHDPIEQYDEKHKAGSQEARSGVARDDHCGRESRRGTRIGGRE